MEGDLEARRRAALATIFDDVATEMVERVVAEAVRASNVFGLTGDVAERYGRSIRATLPSALDALVEADRTERDRKLEALVASVREVSEQHHVPAIIERGLVSIAFGLARRLIGQRAARSGFTADELDAELTAFRTEFEKKLFGSMP
ncbi:MAG TPA: hypothetical protein VGR46_11675 [Candidatus Limnocylindria bacterium]|nr:hypothetical protein [Candidatus Limnocylindria bacterium]